jgi:hypothetical protein
MAETGGGRVRLPVTIDKVLIECLRDLATRRGLRLSELIRSSVRIALIVGFLDEGGVI